MTPKGWLSLLAVWAVVFAVSAMLIVPSPKAPAASTSAGAAIAAGSDAVDRGCPKRSEFERLYQRDYVPCDRKTWNDFEQARIWTADSFAPGDRISIDAEAVSQFKIFRAPQPLNSMLQRGALALSMAGEGVAFHAMLNASVPHVELRGRPVAAELLIPWVGLLSGGAYFPTIHWDTDWLQFPTAPGFQIWCLLRTHTEPHEGGVFLVTSSELDARDDPVRFVWNEDGTVSKLRHTEQRPEYPLSSYADAQEANLTFHYMDLSAGDCLVWSKRTLHMSDPRPHLRGGTNSRMAAHLRVAARSGPGGPIDYWPNHPYANERGSMMWRLKEQSPTMKRKRGYHQLVVEGDELIERNPGNIFRQLMS